MTVRGNGVDACAAPPERLESQYLQLLDHSPVPLCVHVDGRVVYTNPAGVQAIAAPGADHVIGRMITDFVHPDHIAPMLARIAALRHPGDSSPPAEAEMLLLDGTTATAEVVSVLTSWQGKPAYQVVFRDLRLVKVAESTLHLQAALVSHAAEAIIATTPAGCVVNWNPAAETIYRRPAVRALALPISEAVGAEIDPAAIVAAGGVQDCIHRAADGSARSVRVAVAAMDNGYVLVCSDHTALRRAEQRFHSVVNSLEEGVVVLDAHGRPEWINPAARRILGLGAEETLTDVDLSAIYLLSDEAGNSLGPVTAIIERALARGGVTRNTIIGIDLLDGRRCWLSANVRPLDSGDGGPPTVLVSFTDVTARHTEQVMLAHQARHDALTGLPNRANAEARVAHALHGRPPALAAVMFIDLDHIKQINDVLGHHAGDLAITAAAQRLRSALRADDLLARHGGDEFVALVFGQASHAALQRLSDRMHESLTRPLDIAGTEHILTASIGIAEVAAADVRTAAQLLQDADTAMYEAKARRATTRFAHHHTAPRPVLDAALCLE